MLRAQDTTDDERLGEKAALHVYLTHVRAHVIHALERVDIAELEPLADVHPLVLLSNLFADRHVFGLKQGFSEFHGRFVELVELFLDLHVGFESVRLRFLHCVDSIANPLAQLGSDTFVCA